MNVMAASKVRANFAQVLKQAAQDGRVVVVENHGRPRAAIVPLEDLERLKRMADFADAAADWFWEADETHRVIHVAPSSRHSEGYAPIVFQGRRRLDLAEEVANGQSIEAHARDLAARRPFKDFRFRFTGADGQPHWSSSSGLLIHGPEGEFLGCRGTGRDVTREMEEARRLQHVRDSLIGAIESLSETFALWDAEERLVVAGGFRHARSSVVERALIPGIDFGEHLYLLIEAGLVPDAVGQADDWVAARVDPYRRGGDGYEIRRPDGRWLLAFDEKLPDGGTVTTSIDIPARKRMEEWLRRHRDELEDRVRDRTRELADRAAELRLVTNHMPAMITQLDSDLHFTFANNVGETWYARPLDGIVGRHVDEVVSPDALRRLRHRLESVMRGGTMEFDDRLTYPDGVTRDVQITYLPRSGDAGAVAGCISFAIDITERKAAEISLHQSEQRFQDFADVSADLYFETDAELHYSLFSASLAEYGRGEDEFLGKTRMELVTIHHGAGAADGEIEAMLSRRPYRNVERPSDLGGDGWVRVSGLPKYGPDGAFLGYRGGATDITTLKRQEKALAESEENFRRLFEGGRHGIAIFDDTRMVFANAALARIFGYDSVDEVLALPGVEQLIAEGERDRLARHRRMRREGADTPLEYEVEGVRKDGSPVWLHLSAQRVLWEAEWRFANTLVDITARKQVEAEREVLQRRLRAVINAVPADLSVNDPAGRCILVNSTLAAAKGLDFGDFTRCGIVDVFD